LALVLAGCSQIFGLDRPATSDGGADAAICAAASTSCVSADVLRTCTAAGEASIDTQCTWGCIAGPAHCGALMPAGGALIADDLTTPQGLGDTVLMTGTVIDSDTGQIGTALMPMGVRMAGDGIIDGIDYEVRGDVAVFRMKSLSINGAVLGIGTHAIAIVSLGNVTIEAPFDMRGPCAMNVAGPGGFAGGARAAMGIGAGGGNAGPTGSDGGGGAGYGAGGGRAGAIFGAGPSGGSAYGMDTIPALIGGSGGAGGGAPNGSGVGGGGGGALQIASNGAITIGASGGINAGGCGGKGGTGNMAGGAGGGAGGTILLEAPTITIIGALAVNGGSGAAGSDGQNAGEAGHLDRTPALGAAGNGGSGGNGGAGATLGGSPGQNAANAGGGGGGAVGRMRFHTKAGAVTTTPQMVLSPALDDAPTTTTQGAATVL
jgi:hypothetical protein